MDNQKAMTESNQDEVEPTTHDRSYYDPPFLPADPQPEPTLAERIDDTLLDILGEDDWRYSDKPHRIEQLIRSERRAAVEAFAAEVIAFAHEDDYDWQATITRKLEAQRHE